MSKYKIIISGGGTGGHIFPAIAIAEALKKKFEDIEFLFIGASGRMEMQRVPAAGYNIKGLWISGLQRKISLKNLLFPFKVVSSLFKAYNIVRKFKPDAAIGTGGYASGPTLKVAASMGIPSLIQEQNSFPGITNRMLASKVDRICVAYSGLEKWFPSGKIVNTGNPVRKEIAGFVNKREEALQFFGLGNSAPTVLVVGGSLGALTINNSVLQNIKEFNDKGIQIIWQTGKSFYDIALNSASGFKNIKVFDFISCMDKAYSAADVIISRAGAIAISELCCVGKPVILVPSPNVAEDHQTKNALALVKQNAAIMVKDSEAAKELVTQLSELINDDNLKGELAANIIKLAKPNAADTIAEEILNLIKK